jgi:DNA-directed RNA polymerase specialized sigma subunit
MEADLERDARDQRIVDLFAHRFTLVTRMKRLDEREDDDGVIELLNELEENDMAIVDLSEGLVRSYVRRFLGADDRYRDDLLQAGRIGVIESIENFDRRKATWASWAM